MKNFGYACINMHLSDTKKLTSSRTMRKATFEAKGLPAVSELIVSNLSALQTIMQWNADTISTKVLELKARLASDDIDVCAIQETNGGDAYSCPWCPC
mgnify:CR=1 FL=1